MKNCSLLPIRPKRDCTIFFYQISRYYKKAKNIVTRNAITDRAFDEIDDSIQIIFCVHYGILMKYGNWFLLKNFHIFQFLCMQAINFQKIPCFAQRFYYSVGHKRSRAVVSKSSISFTIHIAIMFFSPLHQATDAMQRK